MSDRFVVEADRKVVGIAVRAPGGFKFFSSDASFAGLEGQTFTRVRTLTNAVAKIRRRLQPPRDAGTRQIPAVH
jgi:hypothetical protein